MLRDHVFHFREGFVRQKVGAYSTRAAGVKETGPPSELLVTVRAPVRVSVVESVNVTPIRAVCSRVESRAEISVRYHLD